MFYKKYRFVFENKIICQKDVKKFNIELRGLRVEQNEIIHINFANAVV